MLGTLDEQHIYGPESDFAIKYAYGNKEIALAMQLEERL